MRFGRMSRHMEERGKEALVEALERELLLGERIDSDVRQQLIRGLAGSQLNLLGQALFDHSRRQRSLLLFIFFLSDRRLRFPASMARHLILAAALLLLAVSWTAAPVSAHSANDLANDASNVTVTGGNTSWSVTALNITGGWKMLSDMKGSAFLPTNDAWSQARDGYLKQSAVDPSVKEALNTVVDTKANETALLAMSQGAWNVFHNLAHYHLVIDRVNATFIKTNLTGNTYYRLTSHKNEPIFLYYNNVTDVITVTGTQPAGVSPLVVPSTGNDTHTSHAEVLAVAVPPKGPAAPASTPAPAPVIAPVPAVPGTPTAVGKVVIPDIIDEHGYAVHGIDAVLFPAQTSVLFDNASKPANTTKSGTTIPVIHGISALSMLISSIVLLL
ncbi:unnamed protein product [Closterium sp. Yama58-4]|nr:unnamed protein product [Closterium sp. Yama58-4]